VRTDSEWNNYGVEIVKGRKTAALFEVGDGESPENNKEVAMTQDNDDWDNPK
jgi:hypothetical protein